MTKPRPKPPALEDLPELYIDLKMSMEKLEGMFRQLQAEGTRATLDRMIWKDFETLKKQVKRLEQRAKFDVT